MAASRRTATMPCGRVASGYCKMFRYTFVPGIFPKRAVWGRVTLKRILTKEMQTATRRPISTETKKTPKKAPKVARKSNLSIFHISHAALKSTKEMTAEMMMAARMVFGVYLNKGVSATSVMSTTMAMTMLDMAVLTPAW